MKKLSLILVLCAALAACSKPEGNTTGNANAADQPGAVNAKTTDANGNNVTAKPTPTIDPNFQATFPFKDFPTVETTAKPGGVVLVPSYLWLQQANVYGVDKTTMIWYSQKMVTPDKEM